MYGGQRNPLLLNKGTGVPHRVRLLSMLWAPPWRVGGIRCGFEPMVSCVVCIAPFSGWFQSQKDREHGGGGGRDWPRTDAHLLTYLYWLHFLLLLLLLLVAWLFWSPLPLPNPRPEIRVVLGTSQSITEDVLWRLTPNTSQCDRFV